MKFLFIVQGEGRGHITQAIALYDMLKSEGHEIVHVMIGKSKRREVPEYFFQRIKSEIVLYESPHLVFDAQNKKLQLLLTLIINSLRIVYYLKSLLTINRNVERTNPDVIINFCDSLAGLYSYIFRPKARVICIGHHFLHLHPDFKFPSGFRFSRWLMKINIWITSLRAEKILALSFRPMKDIINKKIYVLPTLLRTEIKKLIPGKQNFILGYILNSGYAEDIKTWHFKNPDMELHFFWDKKDAPEELYISPKLVFHKLNDVKFLQMMSKCKGYSSTAGFESICEAIYLGKPIMMIPTYGHFEQACNALDASIAGAGIKSDTFNLTALLEYKPKYKDIFVEFRRWADSARIRFLNLLAN